MVATEALPATKASEAAQATEASKKVAEVEELPDWSAQDEVKGTKDVAMSDAPESAGPPSTGKNQGLHSQGFKDFLLKDQLIKAIVDCGFEHPSEVQHECIPTAILGTDVLCQAKSGMGKTAVFVLACLQQLNFSESGVKVLVLVHTRELAYQINHEFERFSKYFDGVRIGVMYGGTPVQTDQETLKKNPPHILIGTPGRIGGLVKDESLKLDGVTQFVIDECDKCLEKLDMRREIQKIFMKAPVKKQVMMFSATFNKETRHLCKSFMQDPLEISINEESKLTLDGLLQYYCDISEKEKNRKLNTMLDALEFNQCVIFVSGVTRCIALNRLLDRCGFPSIALHSGITQEDRIKNYNLFKAYKKRILVATDVCGRGIDIEKINIVVNYDMTDETNAYLHRVGRAGRFGTKGLAISYITTDKDKEMLKAVQDRFEVNIDPMPEEIDQTSYLNA